MSENISVEKVMSHEHDQQQRIGGIWVVVKVVFHVPVVLQVFDSIESVCSIPHLETIKEGSG